MTERRQQQRRKIQRAIGEHGCWNDRSGAPSGRTCIDERIPNFDRRQASGAVRNVAPPENEVIVAMADAKPESDLCTCDYRPRIPCVEHPGDFIEFKCGNCGQIKPIARTALRFEHRCAASCETRDAVAEFDKRGRVHGGFLASCETTATGEGRGHYSREELCEQLDSTTDERNELISEDTNLRGVLSSVLKCPGFWHGQGGILEAIAQLVASPTRTQPATEAEAREMAEQYVADFFSRPGTMARSDTIFVMERGSYRKYLVEILAGFAFANHRAATPAAEKEGE